MYRSSLLVLFETAGVKAGRNAVALLAGLPPPLTLCMTSLKSTCRACRLLERSLAFNSNEASRLRYNRHYYATSSDQGRSGVDDKPEAGSSASSSISPSTSYPDHRSAATLSASSSSIHPDGDQDSSSSSQSGDRASQAFHTASTSRKGSDFNAALSQTRALALSRLASIRLAAFNKLQKQQQELGKRFSEAGQRINAVTGYGEIDALKAEVTRQGG